MADISTLTIGDIMQAKRLSDAEKWNQTEKDWELMINHPGNICLAAKTAGKIIGTATAMNYENRIAWIGMVLVDPEYRGQGVSKLLLSELLERLKSFPSVKLDATPAGQKVYQKFGFQNEGLLYRMTIDSISSKLFSCESHYLEKITLTDDISEVAAFEQKIFGANRSTLLNFLSENLGNKAWILEDDGHVKGFALGRKGTRYFQIGPVTASSEEAAKALIMKVAETIENQPVVVDVLEHNHNLIHFLTAAGFTQQRHFIRMFLKPVPSQELHQFQRLVCGPEYG